jgi:hypothetical protein
MDRRYRVYTVKGIKYMKRIWRVVLCVGLALTACGSPFGVTRPATSPEYPLPGEGAQTKPLQYVAGTDLPYPYPSSTPLPYPPFPYPTITSLPYPVPTLGSEPGKDADLPEGAVMRYQQRGGIAGLDRDWVIYADGWITAKDGKSVQVPAEQVTKVLSQVVGMGFFDLQPSYGINTCCDRFEYTLAVAWEGQVYSVYKVDGAENVPPELEDIFGTVASFIQAAAWPK